MAVSKYGMISRLVWDGGDGVRIPEELGKPAPNQMLGTAAERVSELSGRTCFDPETQLLTKSGWVKISELEKGVEVATYNIALDRMEFQAPTDYISKRYVGKMYRAESRSFSLFTTPDHDLYVQINKRGKFDFQKASDVFGECAAMKNSAFYDVAVVEPIEMIGHTYSQAHPTSKKAQTVTRHVPDVLIDVHQMDAWARTLGFYISEGSLNFQPGSGPRVTIYQQEKNVAPIIEAADACGLSPKIFGVDKRNGVAQIKIGGSTLARYLQQFGVKSRQKRIPVYVFEWPATLRESLLDALMFGDGTIGEHGTRIYNTNSKGLAEDVQRLIISLGRPCTINYSECETCLMYRVRETLTKTFSINKYVQQDAWVDYSGGVFCVSVPNRALFTRRDGKVVVAGNCYDSLGRGRSSDDYHKHILEVGHGSVYEHFAMTVELHGDSTMLWALINRPGIWVEADYGKMRVTFNPRAILDWNSWTKKLAYLNDVPDLVGKPGSVGDRLACFAEPAFPKILPRRDRPLSVLQYYGKDRLVEPLSEQEKWISMFLCGSRGWSHEQVRHKFRTAVSQRSTRFVNEAESPWVDHPLVQEYLGDKTQVISDTGEMLRVVESIKKHSRETYAYVVERLEPWLTARGVEKLTARKQARGAARGYLGNALWTEMIFSASVAEWKWMMQLRCSSHADAEIRGIFCEALPELRSSRYADDFKNIELVPAPDGLGQMAVETSGVQV